MRLPAISAALLLTVDAAGVEYNYINNGADWGDQYDTCKGPNQGPIDLSTDRNNPNFKWIPISDDNFGRQYTNQETDITVEWKGTEGYTTQVAVNKAGQDTQVFTSKISRSVYKLFGADDEPDQKFMDTGLGDIYKGVQFHFHAESEHTIDGKRYDFEMHTVHLIADETSDSVFGFAAMGIIFDVNDYNAKLTDSERQLIDNFFDSLELDK